MRLFLLSNCDERAGCGTLMLGVSGMSAASPTDPNGSDTSFDERMDSVIALLRRALDQLDRMKAAPELGARLQEVLDLAVEQRP